jgi:hypothetical protein
MNLQLKLILNKAISSAMEEIYDHHQRPDFLIHPDLEIQMTEAAAIVFDAAVKSSQFTEKES